MKKRSIIYSAVLFIFLTSGMAAQPSKKISWSVVLGGQHSDMNYGLTEARNLLGDRSAFINSGASGSPATGWFAGLGAVYTLHKSVQVGMDITYSLYRTRIEGENSDLRSNVPLLPPPGYTVRLQGHMRYAFAGAGIYGQYVFRQGQKNAFTLKPLLQFQILADHQWSVDLTYEDNSVAKAESWGNLEKPALNNLWWAGIEFGYRVKMNNRSYLHPFLGFHQALNPLHPNNIPPQNLSLGLRLSGI